MKGIIFSAIADVLMLTIAGASFLFGLYLAFERTSLFWSIVLILVSMIIGLIASFYDVTIIKERRKDNKTYEEFKKRNRAA